MDEFGHGKRKKAMSWINRSARFVLVAIATFIAAYIVVGIGAFFLAESRFSDAGIAAGLLGACTAAILAPWAGHWLNKWFNWRVGAIQAGIFLLLIVHASVLWKDVMGLSEYIPDGIPTTSHDQFIRARILMNTLLSISSLVALFLIRWTIKRNGA